VRINGAVLTEEEMKNLIVLASCVLLGSIGSGGASAQNFPTKPVRVIVGFSAGGGADLIARVVSQQLSASLGQPVIVDNRAGAAGNIAAELVVRSPPDGYTLLYGNASLTLSPSVFSNLAYDPVNDLAPISMAASYPYVLASHPSLPARTMKELASLAKRKPGALDYASGGYGTLSHFAMEMMRLRTGIDTVHVSYKGGGPALASLIAGETQIGFVLTPIAATHIKSRKLNALAVTDTKRSPVVPEVPTMREAGFEGVEVLAWNGFLAPARTADAILERLQREVAQAVSSPEVTKQFNAVGASPVGGTRDEFAAFIRAETQKWTDVAKRAGIKPQ
jgi:tripartite-type tricarboxylate transporter receptor subunit TctC